MREVDGVRPVLESTVPVAASPAPVGPIEGVICSYSWDCGTALRVFHCENRTANPTEISRTGDYGITQINRQTWEWWLDRRGFDFASEWMKPERNVAMAYEIWLDGSNVLKRSFHHWSCY